MLYACLYNEDPTYLKVVTSFCFISSQNKFLVSDHAQKCFRENLLNTNRSQKQTSFSSLTAIGVITVAHEIYFVPLHVCRKPYNVNYDVV